MMQIDKAHKTPSFPWHRSNRRELPARRSAWSCRRIPGAGARDARFIPERNNKPQKISATFSRESLIVTHPGEGGTLVLTKR